MLCFWFLQNCLLLLNFQYCFPPLALHKVLSHNHHPLWRFRDEKKLQFLNYLGDTEVGTSTNIGAGTITCNYDGASKHKTLIGDQSFIGSNTSLVAPVTVGSNATVAAGSVITKNVPDGALGIGRSKQDNKQNWSKKKD